MVKHPKSRRRRKYIRGAVDEQTEFATLGARTVASEAFDDTVNERTLVSSIVATYSINSLTQLADTGPFLVGVAHSDYTTTEITEFLQNSGSWNEGDLVNQEIGKRKIRVIGTIATDGDAADSYNLEEGAKIKSKLNWILLQGQTLDLWIMNQGSVAVDATTAPNVHAQGHCNLWPQ